MLKLLGDKPLGARDAAAVERVLMSDPVAMCMVAARFETHGINPRLLGGELWTAQDPSTSLCFSGANLIPLIGSPDDLDHFSDRAVAAPRACSSIVGRADLVLPMWQQIEPVWGAGARGAAGPAAAGPDRMPGGPVGSGRAAGHPR
ncbi:DUF4081 domain-containing protein [Gordonia amicalis]|nr:DUF4081 domain-containing protein [Gordonia amicalis]UOG22285.1 DUF4081 domain-containing protein [Gordonia amicalis]